MENVQNIELGLPEKRQREKPMLKLFNRGNHGEVNNARLIYSDGQMYMLGKSSENKYKWIEFTKIKPEGLKLLEKKIVSDFFTINLEFVAGAANNMLYWQACINGKVKEVVVPSGSYSQLPKAFGQIDELINKFMYKANEHIRK